MNPKQCRRLAWLIENKKTFQIGSRGCSFLCTYIRNGWSIWVDRARLSLLTDSLKLSKIFPEGYGNMMIGYVGDLIVFELNLNEYIKITEDLPRRGAE